MFCLEKDAQNVVTAWITKKICSKLSNSSETKLSIMTMKSLLEVQITNNSEFGC